MTSAQDTGSYKKNTADKAYDLNDDQRQILETADRYCRDKLAPLAARMDDEEWWPDAEFRAMAEMGFLGSTISPEYGGAGLDLVSSGVILQAMSRYNPAMGLSWVAHDNLCANNIYRNASEEIRQKYLPGLCDGTLIGALGLTEPGAGSDALGSMRTTARRDGDEYILNGSKMFITNGPVADVLLIYAKTSPEKGAKGISAFVVEKDFPGFSVAQKLTKMGFRGSQTGELIFDDCRVPASNLVGVEDEGVAVVMSGRDLERAMISPIGLGVCERALELSIEFGKTREQFGRPIGNIHMIQARLADMYVLVETMRTFIYLVLAESDDLEVGGGGRGEIHKLAAASIYFAANSMNKVLDHAVQIHGGAGYIWESEINRLYRHTKLLEIGAGTTEIRQIIIAEELLKA